MQHFNLPLSSDSNKTPGLTLPWLASPIFAICFLLVGCTHPGSLWGPVTTPPPTDTPPNQTALSKPEPYRALYIGNPPAPLADANKKSDIVQVVDMQGLADDPAPAAPTPVSGLHDLYRRAAERVASLGSYQLRIRRREVIGTKEMPEEIMIGRFRREPYSVYFKWVGKEANGREVVYVRNQYENMVHTLLAAGDHPLMAAGRVFKLAPDSILLTSRSRYPITDAGLDSLVARLGRVLGAQEKGDSRLGKLEYLGPVKRPEFPREVLGIRHTVPPNKVDPNLPKGGQRFYYFDAALHLPVLVVAQDETGKDVEYYCHDNFWLDIRWNDDDFNPARLWPKAK